MNDLQTKLGGGLNKIQDSLQQGKQKLHIAQEISQHRKLINEHAVKRAEIILKLGEAAYKKIRNGEMIDEELTTVAKEAVQYDQQIYRAEAELEKLKVTSQLANECPSCGQGLTQGDKFCGSCGHKVEENSVVEQLETKACFTCEEQIPVTASFCSCCGNRVNE